jgi:hypothetical protein
MTVPQTISLKGLTAKGNDCGMDEVWIVTGGGGAGSGSIGRSPRRLLSDGFVADADNECRGGDYDSDENQGNQEIRHFKLSVCGP